MKKILSVLILLLLASKAIAADFSGMKEFSFFKNKDERAVKSLLYSQVRYANRANFNKFISTYDKDYKNSDGFDLAVYSDLVQDIWKTYDNIKYGISIKEISINGDSAEVSLDETSNADIPLSKTMNGVLKSTANSIYYLKKVDGKWKVVSDKVIDESTSMMYGDAIDLDVHLTAPKVVKPGVEYTASLEFVPPEGSLVIASIAKDKIEYPQKQAQEVFRKFPEDNLLERLFIANSDNANEYVVASIGLTKTDVCDLSIKVSLTGFGYQIIRVNVAEGENVQTK